MTSCSLSSLLVGPEVVLESGGEAVELDGAGGEEPLRGQGRRGVEGQGTRSGRSGGGGLPKK